MINILNAHQFANTESEAGEEDGIVLRYGPGLKECLALFCLDARKDKYSLWLRCYVHQNTYASYFMGNHEAMVDALEEDLYPHKEVYVPDQRDIEALERWGFEYVARKARVK